MGRVGRKDGTRELVVSRTSYLIIYTLHEDTVEITARGATLAAAAGALTLRPLALKRPPPP